MSEAKAPEDDQSAITDIQGGQGRGQITVDECIKRFGLGKFQVKMYFLCGLCWTGDAMEIMMMQFLFEELKREWNLGEGLDGIMGGIVFLGMFCGAFFWGLMSDRYGRAFSYFVTSLFVGFFGLLTAASYYEWVFLVCRFFVGFGFGGSHTAYTLWQEFVPEENRGTMLLLNQLFWVLGALLEACLAWAILPHYNWRILMIVSAIVPLLTATFYLCLPESPRFLIVSGRKDEAAQVLRDVARANGHEYPEHLELVVKDGGGDRHQGDFFMLFHRAILVTTLLLVCIWCADTFIYYGSAFVTPKFFKDNASVYTASIIITCSEVPGIFLPMITLDTIGRKATLAILFGTSALFMFLIAYLSDQTAILVCLCVGRLCVSSAFICTFIYTSEIYPTAIRSTGLGFNSAMSRLSGFATSFIATAYFTHDNARAVSSSLYGGFSLAAGIVALLLPYDTKTRPIMDTVNQFEDYNNKIEKISSADKDSDDSGSSSDEDTEFDRADSFATTSSTSSQQSSSNLMRYRQSSAANVLVQHFQQQQQSQSLLADGTSSHNGSGSEEDDDAQ